MLGPAKEREFIVKEATLLKILNLAQSLNGICTVLMQEINGTVFEPLQERLNSATQNLQAAVTATAKELQEAKDVSQVVAQISEKRVKK